MAHNSVSKSALQRATRAQAWHVVYYGDVTQWRGPMGRVEAEQCFDNAPASGWCMQLVNDYTGEIARSEEITDPYGFHPFSELPSLISQGAVIGSCGEMYLNDRRIGYPCGFINPESGGFREVIEQSADGECTLRSVFIPIWRE